MAISSYDSIIASIVAGKSQDRMFSKTLSGNLAVGQALSFWEVGNTPAAGAGGTALTGRNCDPTVTGALTFANPTSPDTQHLICGYAYGTSSAMGTLMVYDRLADVSNISMATTSPQSISMSALPRYTNGEGVQMFLEVSTDISGSPIFTVDYTDQDGNPGTTQPITCAANTFARFAYNSTVYLPLAAGDTGVRGADEFTCSVSAASGVCRLVFARPLVTLPLLTAGAVIEKDFVTQTPRLPRLYDDHCIAFFIVGSSVINGTVHGMLTAVAG